MKLKTKTKDLRSAVKLTALVAGKKSTLPILNHVLLRAEKKSLTILGSNLTSFATASCPCEITEPGALGIPGDKLLGFVDRAESEEITLELEGEKLVATAGRMIVRFAFVDESEFPVFPLIKPEWEIELPEKDLFRGFNTVKPAMSDNVGRMVLCGVNVELKENKANFTASNGSFLLHTSMDHKGEGSAIVPAELVDIITKSLDEDSDALAKMQFSPSGVVVSTDHCIILGSLLEGKFIDWRSYMPKDFKGTYSMPRERVISAIQKVRPFTDERFHPMELVFKDSLLTIKNTGGEHPAQDSVELDCLVAEFNFACNPDYLEKTLASMVNDKVEMRVVDNLSPVVFEEQGFLGVVQVCRLN